MAKAPAQAAKKFDQDPKILQEATAMYEEYVVLRAKTEEAQAAQDAHMEKMNAFAAENGLGEDEPDMSEDGDGV